MSRIDEARACAAGIDMLVKCHEMPCCDCPQEEFSGHVICSDERGFFEHVSVVLLGLASDLEQAQKGRQGRWYTVNDGHGGELMECSHCRFAFRRLHPRRYCPNCGAKMDEEGEK